MLKNVFPYSKMVMYHFQIDDFYVKYQQIVNDTTQMAKGDFCIMVKMPSLLIESMNVKLRELSRDLSNTYAGTIDIKIKAGTCVKVKVVPNHQADEGIENKVGLNIEAKKQLIHLIVTRVTEHSYFPYGHIIVSYKYEDGHFTHAQINFAIETVMN